MKKLIISFISLALTVVLFFVLVKPLFNSVMAKRTLLSEQTAKIGGITEILQATERLKQEYAGISKEAEEFFRALPAEKDIPHFLVEIEELAQRNGLLLESVSFESTEEDSGKKSKKSGSTEESADKTNEPFNKLKAILSLSGSYDSFKGYLTALESSLRPININSMDLSINQNQTASGANLNIFQLELVLSVYYSD